VNVPLPEPILSIFAFATGLVLGSFLNVCIHRMPIGESIAHPRSRCPSCARMIRWYENVPLLSWLALRGRCRGCGVGISVRYPFVELMGGLALLALWRLFGPTAAFGISAAFALAMVVLFFTDYDHQLLPDAVTLTGLGAGLLVAPVNSFLGEGLGHRTLLAFAGAALGAGILWSIGALYTRLRGVEAMGMGDVKMMAMVGAFGGPYAVLFTLFVASIVGALFGLALIPLRGRSISDALPFGCFLAPSALAARLVGRRAVEAYVHYVRQASGGG
jgi:leader peptidase (prepilin peptidase)/N-methyltransferase